MTRETSRLLRCVELINSSRKDLSEFPEEVQGEVGYALYLAQLGERVPSVKTLSGFGGGGVVEIVEEHDGDIYRCVSTVRLKSAV